ncbi:hotdog fold thioesterase [Arcticibacterium luteifluviistationis]|uniref:Thioesterase n=1 Tax=Arcticibacterium luteifluviistationis TaxID=1784714 RepID=A0A2Z4GCL5_9BACT|nr:hotdog fold thioesterase [Arcticibacterium luteifluviistationis]AWV98976.1 thioesterase [Arcticibacterium luteifluviistationis]
MKLTANLKNLNEIGKNTLSEHLGIEIIEVGDDYLKGTMPVDNRTKQPAGILHGGASVAFAETLGSIASYAIVASSGRQIVGLEINANHLRPVTTGLVYGTAKAIHLGRKTHVWQIDISNDQNKLVCVCRFTVMIIEPLA